MTVPTLSASMLFYIMVFRVKKYYIRVKVLKTVGG